MYYSKLYYYYSMTVLEEFHRQTDTQWKFPVEFRWNSTGAGLPPAGGGSWNSPRDLRETLKSPQEP